MCIPIYKRIKNKNECNDNMKNKILIWILFLKIELPYGEKKLVREILIL